MLAIPRPRISGLVAAVPRCTVRAEASICISASCSSGTGCSSRNATVPTAFAFSNAIQTIHCSLSARAPQRSFHEILLSGNTGSQYGALVSALIMAYATLPRYSSSPFLARRMMIPSGSSRLGISSVRRSSKASTRSWPNPISNNPWMTSISAAEMYRLWLKMPLRTQSSPSRAYRSWRIATLSLPANA